KRAGSTPMATASNGAATATTTIPRCIQAPRRSATTSMTTATVLSTSSEEVNIVERHAIPWLHGGGGGGGDGGGLRQRYEPRRLLRRGAVRARRRRHARRPGRAL